MPAQPPSAHASPGSADLIDRLDALLPQTQCGLCKTAGCRPYAEAIANGTAINHCVPGGQATIDAIADLTGRPSLPPDPAYGVAPPHRLVALIREDECIGCTKCIQACPVDAIVGAAKLMHTVLIEECTGCNLCVAPCPVDCIDLVPGPDIPMTWHMARQNAGMSASNRIPMLPAHEPSADELAATHIAKIRADHARERFLARNRRLAAASEEKAARRHAMPVNVPADTTAHAPASPDLSALMIAAAMARSQLKKVEKQLAALQARGEPVDTLEAQLPALQTAAAQAQQALTQAQQHTAPG